MSDSMGKNFYKKALVGGKKSKKKNGIFQFRFFLLPTKVSSYNIPLNSSNFSNCKSRHIILWSSFSILIHRCEPHEYEAFNLGTKLIPMNNVVRAIDDFVGHENDEIIIHCRSGSRSGMAQLLFKAKGFKNVRNVIGGVLAWQNM